MSRMYQALQKVERQRGHERARGGADPRAGTGAVTEGEDGRRLRYDQVRVWMANQGDHGSGVRVVMVAACRRGSGTTTTVAGLGVALSDQQTARVLMVDANLRTPGLDQVYGCDNAGGFSELLAGPGGDGELPARATPRANLFLLTAGLHFRSPAGIFERSALERLVAALRARFDFVVFDAAPLLEFPEGYALAPQVDAVLLVLDAERTSLEDARRATRDLERAGARAAGIVLNRQQDYTPRLLRRVLGRPA
jgi:capsular exopolysaccharide synthesis family protein